MFAIAEGEGEEEEEEEEEEEGQVHTRVTHSTLVRSTLHTPHRAHQHTGLTHPTLGV